MIAIKFLLTSSTFYTAPVYHFYLNLTSLKVLEMLNFVRIFFSYFNKLEQFFLQYNFLQGFSLREDEPV